MKLVTPKEKLVTPKEKLLYLISEGMEIQPTISWLGFNNVRLSFIHSFTQNKLTINLISFL